MSFAPTLPGREFFGLSEDIAYLNAAAYGPLSHDTRLAGARAAADRARPWLIDKAAISASVERVRLLAAGLIGGQADEFAIVSSVSHAMSVAAQTLPVTPGTRVLRLAAEHPSNVFPWEAMIRRGCVEDIVPEPSDGDWTRAVLESLDRPGAPDLSVAALSTLHWADGGRLDLKRIAPAVRARGGAFVIDATHSVGVERVDVNVLQPDFLAFPLFKWLMGPYGYAMLYCAPSRQTGEPTDRSAINSRLTPDLAWGGFMDGARRYDRGERDDPAAIAIMEAALTQISGWGHDAIADRVTALGRLIAKAAVDAGARVLPRDLRSPHVIGVRLPAKVAAATVASRLAAQQVFVSERRGVIRVSPHFYNDQTDVARFAAVLGETLHSG